MAKLLKRFFNYIPQRILMYALTSGAMIICHFDIVAHDESIREMIIHEFGPGESESDCPFVFETDHDILKGEFYWEKSVVAAISQAFTCGYIVSALPVGMMADFYGAKRFVTTGLIIKSILMFLTPAIIRLGRILFLTSRFIQGIAHSMVNLSAITMLSRWAPHTERAFGCGIIYAGAWFGWCVAHIVCKLCYAATGHWQTKSYVFGILGFMWPVVWWRFAFSFPSDSPYIKPDELEFLQEKSAGSKRTNQMLPFTPWKEILTCPAVLSLLVHNLGDCWMHGVMGHIEVYFIGVIRMADQHADIIGCFAATMMGPSAIVWGYMSDWLINNGFMSRTNNRKVVAFAISVVPIIFLVAVMLAGCNDSVAIVFYIVMCYCHGPYYSVVIGNPVDLSPHHAGAVMALIESANSVVFFLLTQVFGEIVSEPTNAVYWRIYFLVSAAPITLFSLPYLFYGSGDVQPWSYFRRVGRQTIRYTP